MIRAAPQGSGIHQPWPDKHTWLDSTPERMRTRKMGTSTSVMLAAGAGDGLGACPLKPAAIAIAGYPLLMAGTADGLCLVTLDLAGPTGPAACKGLGTLLSGLLSPTCTWRRGWRRRRRHDPRGHLCLNYRGLWFKMDIDKSWPRQDWADG